MGKGDGEIQGRYMGKEVGRYMGGTWEVHGRYMGGTWEIQEKGDESVVLYRRLRCGTYRCNHRTSVPACAWVILNIRYSGKSAGGNWC
jgi:hypothetical protein